MKSKENLLLTQMKFSREKLYVVILLFPFLFLQHFKKQE